MKRDTRYYQQHGLLRIFLSYFGPHRRLFLLDMLCALFIGAVDLIFPLISRRAINTMLPAHAYHTFFVVMGIMAAAYLVRAFFYYIIAYYGHTFGIRVEADIRRDLFRHMQSLGYEFYDHNRTGQLMSRLTTDLFEITELAHHGPEDLMISLLTIVGALAVMFTIEWRLALVVCVILPILLIVVITRRRKMSRVSRGVKKRTAAINAEIESSLSGIRTAKAFANEAVEFGKFSEANDRFKVSKREFHREMGIFSGSLEFFLSILSVAVITVGGTLIMQGRMDLVDLFTFSLYISTFTSPVRKLVNFAEMFANGFAGLGRFVELMRTEPKLRDAPDAKALGHVRGAIDVEDVSFSYEENQEVLEHVTLHVQPGETVAVVGPSGGGKSTLCRLIPRFYDVTSGRICIDGQDVRSVTQESLHHAIGVVQQDVFLFADTIANNIRYGRPDATMEEIREAARQAEIYDDIMAMPDAPVRRAEAARVHRAYFPEESAYPDPGRGHERARQCDGVEDPARARPSGRGPHDAHHRPPPFDHPQRLAHSCRGGRPHLRAGHARGAYVPRRPVCDPAQHTGPQQRGMTSANAQKIPDKM